MDNFKRFSLSFAVLVVLLVSLLGCGGGSSGGGQTGSISISPTSATVSGGNTQQFAATVTGPGITSVTWSVNGTTGGSATVGTISGGGLYTAPLAVPSPNPVTVTATSTAMSSLTASASVTVTASQVAVTISPVSANLGINQTQQFTAAVKGTTNTTVGWYVNSILNGNSTVGTISNSGLYTAPATVPANATVTVSATSQADPSMSASASVTISAVSVSISPPGPVSLGVSAQQQFTATVTGATNTSVTWGVAGAGSIDSTGLYTAPATVTTAPETDLVMATSVADTTKSASVSVDLHVVVTLNGATTDTIGVGANRQFTASLAGNSNQSITWSVNGAGGGTIDANTGLYIAPQTVPNPATITVKGTSQFDSSQFATASVTIAANDPLGTVSNVSQGIQPCPAAPDGTLSGATCYSMTVSCGDVADWTTYLKVNQPTGTPVGTVIFGTGTGGSNLYDTIFQFGSTAVGNVLAANFTTVQVSFGAPFTTSQPDGWLTGPGGVRRLACRYATIANWVYTNIRGASSTTPYCGTGNSGGSGALAYALSPYAQDSIFSMAELTSGPPMARIDEGCICSTAVTIPTTCGQGNISSCYSLGDAGIIDTAYGVDSNGNATNPVCTNAVNGNPGADASSLFLSDSLVDGTTKTFNFPHTYVHVLFGGQDNSEAVAQGTIWGDAITSTLKSQACVTDAPHAVADVLDGAQTIASDIIANCKLQ